MSDRPSRHPFRALNLRCNPFGEVPREAWAELTVADLTPRLEQVRAGRVVEFVGDSGRGKTTRLLAMEARLAEATYVHVPEEGEPPELPAGGIVLVDELQFLPARRRRELAGRPSGVAVGTHVSLADEFEAAGRQVESVQLGAGEAGLEERIREMVDRRLGWAARRDAEVPEVSRAGVEWLAARYGANLRATEHHLYEVYQTLQRVRPVEPEDLESAPRPPESVRQPRGDYTPRS